MLNPASKLLLAIAGAGGVIGLLYHVAVDERAGMALLLALGLAALVLAITVSGAAVPDEAPIVPADAPAPERRATTTGSPARGSGWPAFAAVSLATLGATAAAGGPVVVDGVLAVLVAGAGWFAKAWSEDPAWSPRVRERLSFRLLVPVGLPALAFLLAAAIAISLSRILLAVSKNAATGIALVAALAILSACAWVAARPRINSSAILTLTALAVLSTAGAGITGVAAGEREFHHAAGEEHGEPVKVVAEGVKFDTGEIKVAAEEHVEIEFENKDVDVFHNIAVYESEAPDAEPIFNGEGFAGDDHRTYELETPEPGTYYFVCDFHPNMKGAFITEAH
jgi:plastocyanin